MTKKEIEMPVEIKLGQAAYLVERKFVGIESREDILLKKLMEDCSKRVPEIDRNA